MGITFNNCSYSNHRYNYFNSYAIKHKEKTMGKFKELDISIQEEQLLDPMKHEQKRAVLDWLMKRMETHYKFQSTIEEIVNHIKTANIHLMKIDGKI